ncbi:Uncharacterised protein [Metamycoplasma cloacale]|uniref:Uncharacterized protein n=1 Tax=Metamycoplasma cloacale TaxID=92401 RepID=A0A2Z4LLK7_9BACT|nr:hypothetical protein [Metamycoplasma cloacale]AWX42585.1 hypothetical protein DK849_00600 [Metamycoplasma cloacale]VEU79694.1 Uncharacterised protein [Metamycoplasma cloacale]
MLHSQKRLTMNNIIAAIIADIFAIDFINFINGKIEKNMFICNNIYNIRTIKGVNNEPVSL